MHNKTKTSILILATLSWLMSICMLRTFSGAVFQYAPKQFIAVLFGTALGIFMTRDINSYETKLHKAECFAEYIVSYIVFTLTYKLFRSVFEETSFGLEYAGICSAVIMVTALLIIFIVRRKRILNSEPSIAIN